MKTLAVAFLFGCAAIAQQTQTEGPLTDHRVMELARAGVSEQEIIRIISTAPQIDFVLRPDAAEAMAKAGVTDETIRAMAARENRGTVAAPVHSGKLVSPDSPARNYSAKQRVFIDLSNDSWSLTGKGQGSTHPQTVEVMKTFGQNCPNLIVTNDPNKADYRVSFERESHKTIRKHNKFAAFDKNGDMVFSSSTRELGNAVRGFCAAIQ